MPALGRKAELKMIALISLLFIVLAAINWLLSPLQRIDNLWMDLTIRERAEQRPSSKEIIVIDIDDASLTNLAEVAGGWPWPRAIHAELVELVQAQQPKAIVFDILFADRDIFNPHSDEYFAEVLKGYQNIYLPFLHLSTDSDELFPRLDQYPDTVPFIKPSDEKQIPHASLVLPNAVPAEFWRLGSINFHPDLDGVGRHYAAVHPVHHWGIETMPAKVASDLVGFQRKKDSLLLDWYRGEDQPYQRLPYYQVYASLTGQQEYLADGFFKDKIIVIGSTAAGLHDIQVTPISSTYPGVFILATAIDNFLNSQFLTEAVLFQQLLIYLLAYLLILFALFWLRNLLSALMTLSLVIVLMLGLSYWLMLKMAIVLPVISWISIYFLLVGFFYAQQFMQQQREMKKTVDIFGRFLDPKVVKILLEQGLTDQAIAGKSTRVTILFTDIREFTHLSEYRSATEIVELLNKYFSRQVEVIFKHQGTLDKFIGDAIMAFWGEPVDDPGQEIAAVNAALDMIEQMKQFRREYGLFDFDIGIGLHTGDVVVGAIGTHSRYDYTAIGDAVNVASRIEGLTKEAGRRLLVSEETRLACGDAFDFELIGDYKVKGREELVTVYQPRRLNDD